MVKNRNEYRYITRRHQQISVAKSKYQLLGRKTYRPQSSDIDSMPDDAVTGSESNHDAEIEITFNSDGLVPAIAQDVDSGEVLMLAYVSPMALERTRETGHAHYYSRSREELWKKGETSGHIQRIREIRADCDADTILYLVEQTGGACHTGHQSCFYRTLDGTEVTERVFDPETVYES
ncbi:MAG: phosphoribosyl-AMP cyclohydrolase [Haloquadratum walsbyi J07HQW1]|uniref:Phosphoribosyl-AMP cyclohydrolase n=1 Tax=Haloquadratum walsbyi J07HQW1 TaxID=1238424 RepID=U1P9C4_9EURY|nr:MAG: phosphoribosyl-AMP cyclohydrolase [Haloquadratum walsbyi J07HQW1]